jgi:hypothetical protein
MAYGEPVCASCGATEDIHQHHLYLRGDGCPDDLTVWLCGTCHRRAHSMTSDIDWGKARLEGIAKAKANGVKFGRKPKLSPLQRQEAIARRAAGETLKAIAKSYTVDISMISRL